MSISTTFSGLPSLLDTVSDTYYYHTIVRPKGILLAASYPLQTMLCHDEPCYCQILARQAEILQRRAIISADISARLLRVRCNKVSGVNKQKVNCRCQELDTTHFVLLIPTWWIFTPPIEFLPYLENFTPILKISETRKSLQILTFS